MREVTALAFGAIAMLVILQIVAAAERRPLREVSAEARTLH